MPATVHKLGPGELTIGSTPNDFSCQVTAARVEWEVDEGDDVVVLCGETVPGARTYSAKLTATILSDLGAASGIVEFSWTNKGTQHPFVFVPNTVAAKQVSGVVIVDPISIGGDESGQNMTSDFEFACVGDPVIEPVSAALTRELEDETPTGRKTKAA
jgi:hypothetical protein